MSGHLRLDVFDATNTTYQGTLTQTLSTEFVDEYNGPGFGQAVVPLLSADAALLVKDRVVRVIYRDAVRYAWVVETRERTIADSGNRYTLTVSGRGLLAWLEDAVIYPQDGLADYNAPDRPFNYAARDTNMRASGNYTAALGVQWKNDATARAGLPVRWKDASAQWIWKTSPSTAVQRGTVNWFYRDFTLAASTRVKFYASCDNSMTVYLDGTEIMASADFDQDAASFTQMARYTVRLGIGTHTLAARVRNGVAWSRYDLEVTASDDKVSCSGHGLANGTQVKVTAKTNAAGLANNTAYYIRQKTDNDFKLATTNSDSTIVNVTSNGRIDLQLVADNTAGFILTGLEVDEDGKESTVVVRTNTDWQVSSTEPQFKPAMILRGLIEEAATRAVYRTGGITFGFTNSAPTAGSWTTTTDLTLKVGSDLLTVLDDMVDLGHDFWFDPSANRIDAWESRGTDRTATVLLDTGVNIMRFSSTVERPIKTVALVRSQDGWLQAAQETLRSTNGRRETFLEYGSTESEDVAKAQALRVLARTGKSQVVANSVDVAVTAGAVPYVNFDVGDTVSIPDPAGSGGLGQARILSISLKEEGGGVRFSPELEVITNA